MLRRILAVLLTLAGATTLGLAIASGTVWRPADTIAASTTANPSGSNVVITLPGSMEVVASQVDIVVSAGPDDEIAAIIAPTTDVLAYLGADSFDLITGLETWETLEVQAATVPDVEAAMAAPPTPSSGAASGSPSAAESEPASESAAGDSSAEEAPEADPAADPAAEAAPEADPAADPAAEAAPEADPAADPAAEAATETATEEDGAAGPVHLDPRGLDLWANLATSTGEMQMDWTRSFGRWSLMAANLTEGGAAPTITMTWARVVETPYFIPGIGLGAGLLLLGLAWTGYEISRARRMRVRPARGRRAAPVPVLPLGREDEPVVEPTPAVADVTEVDEPKDEATPPGEPPSDEATAADDPPSDEATPVGEPAEDAKEPTLSAEDAKEPTLSVEVPEDPDDPEAPPSGGGAWRRSWNLGEEKP